MGRRSSNERYRSGPLHTAITGVLQLVSTLHRKTRQNPAKLRLT